MADGGGASPFGDATAKKGTNMRNRLTWLALLKAAILVTAHFIPPDTGHDRYEATAAQNLSGERIL